MTIKVLEQDWHRNGIGGEGFVASLVEWTDAATGPFLVISFPDSEDGRDTSSPEDRRNVFIARTAAINVLMTLITDKGVTFAKGNSWRGSDYLGPAVADAWRKRCRTSTSPYDPFDPDWSAA